MAARPQARMDMRCVDLESELLIYDERRGLVHMLNSTARRIWQLCDGSNEVSQIAQEVQRLFPQVSADQIQRDVDRALSDLQAQDVLTWI